jgi:hypothetical protein
VVHTFPRQKSKDSRLPQRHQTEREKGGQPIWLQHTAPHYEYLTPPQRQQSSSLQQKKGERDQLVRRQAPVQHSRPLAPTTQPAWLQAPPQRPTQPVPHSEESVPPQRKQFSSLHVKKGERDQSVRRQAPVQHSRPLAPTTQPAWLQTPPQRPTQLVPHQKQQSVSLQPVHGVLSLPQMGQQVQTFAPSWFLNPLLCYNNPGFAVNSQAVAVGAYGPSFTLPPGRELLRSTPAPTPRSL